MNSTMIGTCFHIVAQVTISTIPPAQFAIDANIRRNLSIRVPRLEWPARRGKSYAFFRTPNSPLRATKMSPIVACVVMSVAAVSGPNSKSPLTG